MRMLSIDFGTSNTVVALAVDGQAPRTITFDASPLLPSAVFVAANGSVTVGREAQRQARLDPARYEANPKRRIDDGEVLLGDRVVGVVDLIAAVLRNVATEVRRQLGGAAPDEVRLTHPAQWGATRQNTLVSAARSAALGNNLVLIPEPVAAAAQYTQLPGRTLAPGGTVAVYDLGGGTFDIAVVGRTQNDFHVLAEAGLADLGGLDFDQAVLDHVGRGTSAADPARWQQILRPSDASSRRAARALAEDVRAAKETLSRYPQTEVALPDPFSDMHLTRPEFEGLIRPNLVRSIEVLQTTLRNAGVGPERLTGIFLVGGSSRIPLVAKLIQEQLGVTPVALDQPETAVALGALLVPVHREGNRTVAFGPSSAGNSNSGQGQQGVAQGIGPSSAGQRALSGAGVSGPAVSGPAPTRAAGRSGPLPTSVLLAGSPKSRTSLWVAIGVVVVLVVATVILLVAKPFSGKADQGSSTPSTVSGGQSSGTGTSGSTGSGSPTAKSSPSASSTAAVAGTVPGVGPGKALTAAELALLGPSASTLTNCGDNTEAFNATSPGFKEKRVLRCEVPSSSDGSDPNALVGRTLLYVLTAPDAAAAGKVLAKIKSERKQDSYSATDPSGQSSTGAGTVQVVVADHESAFGTGQDGKGNAVMAWTIGNQPYVGVMVSLGFDTADELYKYFQINYKPR